MTLRTALTQALQVRYPVVLAAMDVATDARLARSVTEAGGFAFVGAGYGGEAWLSGELESIASCARRNRRSFGVGFASWSLEGQPALLDLALRHGPKAIWLSFGAPDPWIERIHAAGALAVCQVQSEAMADAAVRAGADILVAQGEESTDDGDRAGGLRLLPSVVELAGPGVPVIAAGGFANGRGLAAAVMLGACGVVLDPSFFGKQSSVDVDQGPTDVSSPSLHAASPPDSPGNRSVAKDHLKYWLGREIERLRGSPGEEGRYAGGLDQADTDSALAADLAVSVAALVDEAEEALRGVRCFPSRAQ